ncbi:MAG: 16S rRNA (cytosine(1402)-N(4))-methyltransferase, partial [Bacteroidota bacterium]
AKRLANTIQAKRKQRIRTSEQLKKIIANCVRKGKENQYYAKMFQALRIEVNDELNALKELLMQSKELIKESGRIVVISYHSLEDKLVKNFFRSGKFEGEAEKDVFGNTLIPFCAITRKPIFPDKKEIERNSRARSANLRVAEKK